MGRETKILLALLTTLAGVFLGVLSMKLLVPRPPIGAGPDVHVDVADTEQHELVDPPSPSPSASGPAAVSLAAGGASFADAGPLVPPRSPERGFTPETGDLLPPPMALEPPVGQSPGNSSSTAEVAASQPVAAAAVPAAPPRRDPFVAPAGLQMPITQQPGSQQPGSQQPGSQQPVTESEPPAEPLPTPAATYVASQGDSWWGLAERAYGDGRFYRALFAWNRVIDPRVSLAPGTRLEIPSRARLEAAWPKLMPAE